MKVGSAVLGLHIVAVVAFSLTQGCVTTESQGSGRGAGARHKGPWRHQHTGKSTQPETVSQESWSNNPGDELDNGYDEVVIVGGEISSGPDMVVTPIATSSASTETYIVQKGDILGRIAVKFDTTTQTLMQLNGLSNPDVIYVGQELRVPAGRSSATGTSSAPTSATPSSVKKGGEYMVQKGDTLSGIAVAAGVSLNDLRSLNGITDDKIFAGKTIDIPSGGVVPTTTQKVTKTDVKPDPKVDSEAVEAPKVLEPEVPEVKTGAPTIEVDAVIDHLVYPGETLDDIARKHNATKADIMRLNSLADESAIKVGMILRVPVAE